MKKIFVLLIFFLVLLILYSNKDLFIDRIINKKYIPMEINNNEYSRNYNFKYVKLTNNFYPSNKQDIMNIYFTVINSGMDEFTFYCKKEYENCEKDINDIGKDQVVVSNINNFIHPYNSFNEIETKTVPNTFLNILKVTIKIKSKNYDENMKSILNNEINKIIKNNIKNNMTDREKIKTIHDYIINHTKYDKDRSDNKIFTYKSDTAYGAIIEGYAVCSGYSDAMMLFLEKLNIKNYKISTINHVWNYVYLDNKWYHLDLTFDDPVNDLGKDILNDNYFLITDQKLFKLDEMEHNYDKTVYNE